MRVLAAKGAAAAIAFKIVVFKVLAFLFFSFFNLYLRRCWSFNRFDLWLLNIWVDACLPLYAFKKVDSIVSEKKGVGVFEYDKGKPPVAFLDSLLLGEV